MADITTVSSFADLGGKATVLATVSMKAWNWIPGVQDINEGLIFVTGILGLVYLVVKIRGGLLDNKIKRKKLKE